ncbi:hypothetical protein D3C81_1579620 [compost metagenome]
MHKARQGVGRRRSDVRLHHIYRLLRLERHVQAQVVGEFRSGVQALFAQVGLGVVELGEKLPQQQAQQYQGKHRQRTLDRPAQGGGGRLWRGTQCRRMIKVGQALILRLGWRWQGRIMHGVCRCLVDAQRWRTIRPDT